MNLKEINGRIDFLDSKILTLLNSRMEFVLTAKKIEPRTEEMEREKGFPDLIRKNSMGLINAEFIEKIYVEIIKESKDLQKNDYKLIGFRGEHGAYGEVAAREWNSAFIPIPCKEYAELFEGVQSGLFDYGIVPVENSLGGVVGQVNELLINTDLHVVGAIELDIHLCLLALPGTDHREIHAVYSGSQILAQCRNFLARNKLEPVPYYDAASAAKMLAEQSPKSSAVIGSMLSAEWYNLEVIKKDIHDFNVNISRFLILSKEANKEEGDKCSIIFSTQHKAGTLFRVLEVFAKADINLTRIGSIPDELGSYVFFLDFEGTKKDDKIVNTLGEVEKVTTEFRLIGCYKERKT